MRRRSWVALAVVAAGVFLGIGSAGAITFGGHDGNRHPWVGLVVFFDAEGAPIQRCSGSLLSKTTFLTVAHCTGAVEEEGVPAPSLARIWFDEGPIEFDPKYEGGSCDIGTYTGYPCAGQDATGVPVPHPNWPGSLELPQTSDVGIVEITSPSPGLPTSYGKLAPVGFADDLGNDDNDRGKGDDRRKKDDDRKKHDSGSPSFTLVGYGAQEITPDFVAILQRMRATVDLMDGKHSVTGDWNIQFTGHPAKGQGRDDGDRDRRKVRDDGFAGDFAKGQVKAVGRDSDQDKGRDDDSGGACYGDSGGPVLSDTRNGEVIVAVISFLFTADCTGPAAGYRVDTDYAQDFIAHPDAT